MQTLVEDFLQYLRHERGQSDNTAKTYAALLGKFTDWAAKQNLTEWKSVELKHLMAFLQHERARPRADEPKESVKRLSGESVYLEIAALRAFYKFAENEKLLPANIAENLSLPRRWKRLPKALSNDEIKKLLAPENPETPEGLCDQAILELAYASGLRLSELKNLRLEQLHLDAGFINVIGKGNKERVVPVGKTAVAALNRYIVVGRPKLVTKKSPANVFLNEARHAVRLGHAVAAHQESRSPRRRGAQYHAAYVAPQFRDASAGARRGFARDSGITRPREHRHDGNLYARHGKSFTRDSPKVSSASVNFLTANTSNARKKKLLPERFFAWFAYFAVYFPLLKIVNDDFFNEGFYAVRDELQVLRMDLIIVLRLLVGEDGVKRDLVSLVNDGPRAANHFTDVKMRQARDIF